MQSGPSRDIPSIPRYSVFQDKGTDMDAFETILGYPNKPQDAKVFRDKGTNMDVFGTILGYPEYPKILSIPG